MLIRKGIKNYTLLYAETTGRSRGGQIRKKYKYKTRAKKQSWKKRWCHFQLHWKKKKNKKTHQQEIQHNSTSEARLSAAPGLRGRREAEQRLRTDPPNSTAKHLQTPSHSLLTKAWSQSTSRRLRWVIPFLHSCTHTPNPATPELPSKDTLSSQSVQTLTSTTAKKVRS